MRLNKIYTISSLKGQLILQITLLNISKLIEKFSNFSSISIHVFLLRFFNISDTFLFTFFIVKF